MPLSLAAAAAGPADSADEADDAMDCDDPARDPHLTIPSDPSCPLPHQKTALPRLLRVQKRLWSIFSSRAATPSRSCVCRILSRDAQIKLCLPTPPSAHVSQLPSSLASPTHMISNINAFEA
jgi:hypothetical protein